MTQPNEPATPATDPEDDAGQPPPAGTPVETPDPRAQLDPDEDDSVYDSSGEPLGRAAKVGLRAAKRALQKENSELRERLDRTNRRDAERAAADLLKDGSDLWAHGVKVADLLDDNGVIDPARVEQAARDAIAAHPHWGRAEAAPPADQVTSAGRVTAQQDVDAAELFGGALKAAAQRGRAAHPNN